MNIASMFLRILAILGALAAAAMFWMIGDTKDQLETELQGAESDLRQVEGDLDTVEEERDALSTEIASLNENLEQVEANRMQLENQLTQVRRELAEANEAMSARDQQAEALRAEAANIRRQLLDERTRVSELEENLQSDDAAALRASIQALEQELLGAEQQLQTLGANEETTATDQPAERRREVIRGEVTEVAPDSTFILLNIGSTAGVREGSSVMIRRGPRYIGRAIVAEVHEDATVAEIQTGAGEVRPGDRALTLN